MVHDIQTKYFNISVAALCNDVSVLKNETVQVPDLGFLVFHHLFFALEDR